MSPVILYRGKDFESDELESATKHFRCISNRALIPEYSLVIGRYSVLPYYPELVDELACNTSALINSVRQHHYIADLANWYRDLKGLTPKTWFRLEDIPDDEGPFFLKGKTNSKKFQWDTHAFAKTKREAIDVYGRLSEDGLVGEQEIYIRKFIPLVTYDHGPRGIPITKEFRFFVCDRQVLCGAYYWSNYPEYKQDPYDVPTAFLDKVIEAIGENARFYTIDVGQTTAGEYVVVEINDGQMAGLSMNEPEALYSALARVLK